MLSTIEETARFTVSAADLFAIYIDPVRHSHALGNRVEISPEPGAEFRAFDGQVRGRNLLVEPDRRIVQSWRGSIWNADDPDSIVILTFDDTQGGGIVHLVHANIPEHCRPHIDWERAYWHPWRRYLAGVSANADSRRK